MSEHRHGIYFGLPEADYHADPALGSSSMKQLAYSPPDYWFNSPHNPMREPQKSTPAQVLGSAYHKMVLEGADAFSRVYGIKREKWNTKAGFAERDYFEAMKLTPIEEEDWTRIALADSVVKANPHLAQAFTGGPTEVSIFWDDNGIPKKARIDCLKQKSTVDLKTIAPMDGIEFPDACRRAMATYHYSVQCLHYLDGRAHLRRFIDDGMVYGDHDAAQLARAADFKACSSVFVFIKKGGAPLTYACSISPGNPLLQIARSTIIKADENYRSFKKQFGMDTPWLVNPPIEEIAVEDFPAWYRTL